MTSVSYTLTLADWDALVKSVEKKSYGSARWFIEWVLPVLGGWAGLMPLYLLWKGSNFPQINNWFSCCAFAVLMVGISFWNRLVKARSRRIFRNNPHFGSEEHLGLDKTGVRETGIHADTWFSWKLVARVEETDAHIFLFLETKHSFIVPKRGFASPTEARSFVAAAQKFWREAHSLPPLSPLVKP